MQCTRWNVPGRIGAALALFAVSCAPTEIPQFRDGDIIFQTSKSSQSRALQLAMNSPYSHMGVIFIESDGPVVLEAVGPVRRTPLSDWIERGEKGRYVVKRLAKSDELLTRDSVARLEEVGERYAGLPYDLRFEWADDKIYCSELVWKMYHQALGLEVGEVETFRDFNLTDPAVVQKLEERFGGEVPLDEKVVSPASMFDSDHLVTVYEN